MTPYEPTSQMWDDIKAFHQKFQLPSLPEPGFADQNLMDFRIKFLEEELQEFKDSCDAGDLAGAFDALVDLTYVAMGTAYLMGLPWQNGWNAVQEANMQKVRAAHAGESKRGSSSDVVKPAGWLPPSMEKEIQNHVLRQQLAAIYARVAEDPSLIDKIQGIVSEPAQR